MVAGAGHADRPVPATVDGVFRAPCDPLVLAVDSAHRLGAFGTLLDWRLAGRLGRHLARTPPDAGAPLLVPGDALLPVARFLLVVATTPPDHLVGCLRGLGAVRPGLCPQEFGWAPEVVSTAFGELPVVLYRGVVA